MKMDLKLKTNVFSRFSVEIKVNCQLIFQINALKRFKSKYGCQIRYIELLSYKQQHIFTQIRDQVKKHTIMEFLNITKKNQQIIWNSFTKYINAFHIDIKNTLSLDLDISQMFKIAITYFKSNREDMKQQLFRICMDVFYQGNNSKQFITALQNTFNRRNFAGKILTFKDQENMENYYINIVGLMHSQFQSHKQKIQTFAQKLFLERFQQIVIDYVQIKHNSQYKFISQANQYMKYYPLILQNVINQKQLVKEWKFNKKTIDTLYQKIKPKSNINNKNKAIIKLYEKFIQSNAIIKFHYKAYQLIQYLHTLTNQQFEQEFNILNDNDINEFIQYVEEKKIETLEGLRMRANIMKHAEKAYIRINFTSTFTIESIPNDLILAMLYNAENKLLMLGCYHFLIIRRVSDNMILKSTVTDANIQQIEQLLKCCHDEQLYDVVLTTQFVNYQNIQNIKIRYLNCLYYKQKDKIEITLKYPQDIISATLHQVTITNMQQCINLENLYSIFNTYEQTTIESLQNLRRVFTVKDKFFTKGCFRWQCFFNKTQLEFFQMESMYSANRASNITLDQNIQQLKYLYILQQKLKQNITLDISNENPETLCVCFISTSENAQFKYGRIKGSPEQIESLKRSLVNDMYAKE